MPLLSAKSLYKTYALRKNFWQTELIPTTVLSDVSFELNKGEILAIVGESGSGKSTLARCLLRLESLTSGQIFFEGKEITKIPFVEFQPFRRNFGMIFQDPYASLSPRMKILDNVAEGLVIHKLHNATDRAKKVISLLQQVGLTAESAHKYPHELSGGQKQRVCIARALILSPKILICDEPLSALDVSMQIQIIELLKVLQKTLQLSYIFISHDLRLVKRIADRVLVLQAGKIVEQGMVDEVFTSPQTSYTKELLSAIPGHRFFSVFN